MIGGEFEITLNPHSGIFSPSPDTYYYASGRSALYQILTSFIPRRRKVWLPDYLCYTVVEAVKKAGYEYAFFEVNDSLIASPEALDAAGFKGGDVVLLINYFGLQDLRPMSKEIKEAFPESIVIEDDVQAYYCFVEENNPYADYRFTSLRKGLPVPDGGLVYTKKPMPVVSKPDTFAAYKILAGQMKSRRGKDGMKDEDYLALFEKGAELIDDDYDAAMSDEGKRLLSQSEVEKAKTRRQINARHILHGMRQLNLVPLIPVPDDKVPLFIPIFIHDRNQVRRRMFANEVFCPVHWPLPEEMPIKRGYTMAEHELSLIVDQRYSQKDMDFILELLR